MASLLEPYLLVSSSIVLDIPPFTSSVIKSEVVFISTPFLSWRNTSYKISKKYSTKRKIENSSSKCHTLQLKNPLGQITWWKTMETNIASIFWRNVYIPHSCYPIQYQVRWNSLQVEQPALPRFCALVRAKTALQIKQNQSSISIAKSAFNNSHKNCHLPTWPKVLTMEIFSWYLFVK